jgi:prepilin-type N-terminal cleavage/methylation domain-containing protein
MLTTRIRKSSGFTLIELLVVIAIIGVLASVVLGSLNQARGKARDTVRKSNLRQISVALELYYDKYNTYLVAGSGWSGCGCGWLGYEGGAYVNAVTRILYNEGMLPQALVDDPGTKPGYMLYLCDGYTSYALAATLENPTATDIANIQAATTCNGSAMNTTYGKNYAVSLR